MRMRMDGQKICHPIQKDFEATLILTCDFGDIGEKSSSSTRSEEVPCTSELEKGRTAVFQRHTCACRTTMAEMISFKINPFYSGIRIAQYSLERRRLLLRIHTGRVHLMQLRSVGSFTIMFLELQSPLYPRQPGSRACYLCYP